MYDKAKMYEKFDKKLIWNIELQQLILQTIVIVYFLYKIMKMDSYNKVSYVISFQQYKIFLKLF